MVSSSEKSPATPLSAPATESGTLSGLSVPEPRSCRKVKKQRGMSLHVLHVMLRVVCLATSVVALSLMVTSKQSSTLSLYGFQLPVYSKWSFADSFEYLVGVSGAVGAHSLLQLIISLSRLRRKALIVPSRNYAWIIYAGDQMFAYAMMSAASAASGVTSLNRTGIRHMALPNFCKPLHAFCSRVGASIAFAYLTCILLAASTVVDVIWLNHY